MKHWRKFYKCDCETGGIMLSYEYEDKFPCIDLAFFNLGHPEGCSRSLGERLRWCWHILRKGHPYTDMVILKKEIAKELGKDLLEWAEKVRCSKCMLPKSKSIERRLRNYEEEKNELE